MIAFDEFTLENGLRVIIHQDHTTPIAAFNLLYGVGARDEEEEKTGFAHLFEHLMFGGSAHIPSYDTPLQEVGGENNAFTSNDITNYYVTLPVANLETAFWLESDRMWSLSFDPKVLEVQRKVVIEEFKQRYLNQPYGDAWLHLRPLAYTQHPYRWNTIGKDISHIEEATMEDVKHFFYRYYRPNNAILVVAGAVTVEEVKQLAEKWFGDIPRGKKFGRKYPKEPKQSTARVKEVSADVPLDALYKVYHMAARTDKTYHTHDLLSDLLGRGKSSRLFHRLVKENNMFNDIGAYVTGTVDKGLLVIQGKLNPSVKLPEANQVIEAITEQIRTEAVSEEELVKVTNKAISTVTFGETELLNRAMSLAYFSFLGETEAVNKEVEKLEQITPAHIQKEASKILDKENCSTLYYKAI
ncbi:MAG: M16 family metallopeptidase [Thermonemataceae bacterium]